MDHGVSTSIAVVTAVAAREDVHPVQLTPPLHEVIDADAHDALYHSSDPDDDGSNVTVEFTYCGYDVCVDNSGQVTVTSQQSAADANCQSAEDSIVD